MAKRTLAEQSLDAAVNHFGDMAGGWSEDQHLIVLAIDPEGISMSTTTMPHTMMAQALAHATNQVEIAMLKARLELLQNS